jgi:adenylate cyclase
MQALSKHGPRIAVTLLPLLLAVLHAVGVLPMGVLPMGVLQRLDDIFTTPACAPPCRPRATSGW